MTEPMTRDEPTQGRPDDHQTLLPQGRRVRARLPARRAAFGRVAVADRPQPRRSACRSTPGQVFGASERLQPAIEAPASVSFITAQEIHRYGYRTLADVLRSVRGIYVTNDRNFSFIGARGFGKPGDYNSRILLLINGHRVNDNVFGQAEIGAEFGLDAANVRAGRDHPRARLVALRRQRVLRRRQRDHAVGRVAERHGGRPSRAARSARSSCASSAGRRLSNGLDVMLSSTYEHSDGVNRLFFPAFDTPETNNGVAEGLDAEGRQAVLRPHDLQGPGGNLDVRHPPPRRSHRVVGSVVQRAVLAARRRPTGTECWMPTMCGRSATRG